MNLNPEKIEALLACVPFYFLDGVALPLKEQIWSLGLLMDLCLSLDT